MEKDMKPDSLASVFIGITKNGDLVGAFKTTKSQFQPFQIWTYPLNDEGATSRVILSGGKVDNKPTVFARLINASGMETNWIMLTADNTVSAGLDPDARR